MNLRVRFLLSACFVLPVSGYAVYSYVDPSLPNLDIPERSNFTADERSQLLRRVRTSCEVRDVTRFITEQRKLVAKRPTDGAQLRILAEGLLERTATRVCPKGVRPGQALFAEPPAELVRDVDEALQHLEKARALGDETSENYRIEACLLTYKVTDITSALVYSRAASQALTKSLELDDKNPRLHLTLGCRKLYAPPFLGQDLKKALEHLEFAAREIPLDERPLVFAAHTAALLEDEKRALEFLDAAIARTPKNFFAVEVRRRIRAGENDPFGRDVER